MKVKKFLGKWINIENENDYYVHFVESPTETCSLGLTLVQYLHQTSSNSNEQHRKGSKKRNDG